MTMEELNEFDKRLANHEREMFEKYKNRSEAYREKFKGFGCEIVLCLWWKYDGEKKAYNTRPLLLPGYECGVNCDIIMEGKIVDIESEEIYMSMSWMLYVWPKGRLRRSLERHFKVSYPITDLENEVDDDFDETLTEWLDILKHINN